jgi:hypothetical protein
MPSESVCQDARSWEEVGSFHIRLVVWFMIFMASVRNVLDTPFYTNSVSEQSIIIIIINVIINCN